LVAGADPHGRWAIGAGGRTFGSFGLGEIPARAGVLALGIGPVGGLDGIADLAPGAETGIKEPGGGQLVDGVPVAGPDVGGRLVDDSAVVGQAEGSEMVELLGGEGVAARLGVEILDPEEKSPSSPTGEEPRQERSAQVPNVKAARRAGGEATDNHRLIV
jgi:hypothetical protein